MLTELHRSTALDERRLRRDRVDGKTPSVSMEHPGKRALEYFFTSETFGTARHLQWLKRRESATSGSPRLASCRRRIVQLFFLQRACAHNYAHHAPLRGGLVCRACRLSAAESRSPRSCGRALRRLKLPRRLKVWHVLPRGRRPERRQVGALSRRADLIRLSRPLRHDAVCHWQWQPCPTPPIVTPHSTGR